MTAGIGPAVAAVPAVEAVTILAPSLRRHSGTPIPHYALLKYNKIKLP